MLEKINRYNGKIIWDTLGRILAYDANVPTLLGLPPATSIILKPIVSFIEGRDLTECKGLPRRSEQSNDTQAIRFYK